MVDPAAAIEAGAKLRPDDLSAQSARAGYREEYFGSGPTPRGDDGGPAGWLAPSAGGLGAVLLALAVVLWRGRNPSDRNPGDRTPGGKNPGGRTPGSRTPGSWGPGSGSHGGPGPYTGGNPPPPGYSPFPTGPRR